MTVRTPITHTTAETRFVDAAGVELAYRRFGSRAEDGRRAAP
jgi:hypothetical protein